MEALKVQAVPGAPLVSSLEELAPATTTITLLSQDVLCSILLRLDVRSICATARVSRRMQDAANDEDRMWQALCHRRWGAVTTLPLWLQQPSASPGPHYTRGSSSGVEHPRTYR